MKPKLLLTLLFCLAFLPVLPADPVSLDGQWRFRADYRNEGELHEWYSLSLDDNAWDRMPVPGNWDIFNRYAEFSGKGWYRRNFTAPELAAGESLSLLFEAVNIDYTVWVNGAQVGRITGGYFPERFDITRYVKPGSGNQLTVCVDNTFRSGAYWNWGGIRRPVKLEIQKPVRLENMRVTSRPDLRSGRAEILLEITAVNRLPESAPMIVRWSVSRKGTVVATSEQRLILAGDSTKKISCKFRLKPSEVHLWHFDRPELYTCRAELRDAAGAVSGLTVRTGIRMLEVCDGRFLLNGEPIRTVGFNWVADDRFTGNTLPAERIREDINLMKNCGANLARLSHLPLPDDVYDYLDSVGMMIFDEIPVWGPSPLVGNDSPLAMEWLGKMVHNHYNHPCIIGWSIGNEYGNMDKSPEALEYSAAMTACARRMDSTRLVINVSNTAHYQNPDPADFSDLTAINLYSSKWGENTVRAHTGREDKPVFLAEYGKDLLSEAPDCCGAFDGLLSELRGKPFLMGVSLWTLNDYRSSWRSNTQSWETPPTQNRTWGLVDAYRNRKRAYERIRREYAPVRAMEVDGAGARYTVRITPRGANDLPAYTMSGYKIRTTICGKSSDTLEIRETPLPVITPGSKDLALSIRTATDNERIGILAFSLCNPMGYALLDTVVCRMSPQVPQIEDVMAADGKVRVLFDPLPYTEYRLEYSSGEATFESAPTLAGYVDVSDLKPGAVYTLRLIARNGAGECASIPRRITVPSGGILPPVVKAVASNFGGINIGYDSQKTDYAYVIEYRPFAAPDSAARTILTRNRGACFIPDLEPNVRYLVRLAVIDQYNVQSLWSEPHEIVVRPYGKLP